MKKKANESLKKNERNKEYDNNYYRNRNEKTKEYDKNRRNKRFCHVH